MSGFLDIFVEMFDMKTKELKTVIRKILFQQVIVCVNFLYFSCCFFIQNELEKLIIWKAFEEILHKSTFLTAETLRLQNLKGITWSLQFAVNNSSQVS